MTFESKYWFQSKTIIGSAVAVLGVIARLLGYEIAEADQAALVDIAATLATIGGSSLAIWGRAVASKTIRSGS